jgi:anaerobic selenocysteine-containing dehydrogenase
MARHSKFRACPLCEAICGLELQYEDGRLAAIRGDDADPFSRGHICPKGNAILDLENDPDRLRRPMRRENGQWHEISWDEAFTFAGERLAAIQAEHGAAAIGAYLGNPNVHHFGHIAYLPALLKLIRSPNVFSASSVDQWPHQLVNAQMYGHQFLLPIPDIDHTDYFLMLGANPIASNGSLMTVPDVRARIKALTARGKLVVIDPRRTETAELASEHHFITPAGDVYFLIAFLQALQQLGPPRLNAYAGKLQGFEQAITAIGAFRIADIAKRTAIPAETITRMASDFYQAPRAVAYGRMGVSVQAHGSLCQWLLQLINLYTGNLDKPGGALVNDAVLPITGPGTSPGARGRWHSRVRGLPEFAGELPVSALCEEISTPGQGQIRALITSAGNPVLSTPDGVALDAALSGLDFMLSIDIYINESTRHADLILPPASFLTQDHYDSVFNAFAVRRVARLNRPVQERSLEERADWEIINGLGAAFAAASGREWRTLPPPKALIAAGLARGSSGLSMAELEAAEHGIDLGPLRPSLLERLETPSGCIEAAPELFMQALAELQSQALPEIDAASLMLIGRRDIRSNNSWMHNAPRLVKGKPRHQLLMHADDLQSRHLIDGQQVRVRSSTGEIIVDVKACNELMRGVVCLPHGFGHQRVGLQLRRAEAVTGPSYNDLTGRTALDGPSGNAALNGVPVWVEAL